MAEVRIAIIAEDKASQVFSAVEKAGASAFKKLQTGVQTPLTATHNLSKGFKELGRAMTALSFVPIIGDFTAMGSIIAHTAGSFKSLMGAIKTFSLVSISALGTLGIAGLAIAAAGAGFLLGKAIDSWTYKLTGIDLSGMNKVKELMEDINKQQEAMKGQAEKNITAMARLGIGGATEAERRSNFNAAIKEGMILYDQETHKWITASEKKQKTLESLTKTLQDYSKFIFSIGATELKFAGKEFTSNLKAQEQSIDGMVNALSDYLGVMDNVYSKQLQYQKNIESAMKTQGSPLGAIVQQGIAVLEAEKAQAEARLGAWSNYYETLKGLHASAIDAQKTKTQELLELEKQIKNQRQGYADLELSLRQRLMTETEKYYSTQENLEGKYKSAMALSGQAKIDALTQWQQASASAAQAVTEGNKIIVSEEQAVATALDQISEAQSAIKQEQESMTAAKQTEIDLTKQWASELGLAMAKATEMVGLYKQQILDLGATIAGIQEKEITIKIDTAQAVLAVDELKSKLDSIPDVTTKTVIIKTYTESSPIKPFTEGIAYMQEKLNSLSGAGEYTMDLSALSSLIGVYSDIAKVIAPYAARTAGTPVEYGKSTMFAMEQSVRGLFEPMTLLLNKIFQKFGQGFQTGTPYVPQTGLYQLHRGEAVIPASQNNYNNKSSQQITYAPVININGANKSPQEIATEVDKVLAKRARYNRSEFAREMN